MVFYGKKAVSMLLLAAVLLPSFVVAEDTDRLAALEARIAALEEKMETIIGVEEEPAPQTQSFAPGETFQLEAGKTLTVQKYDTGARFRYSPAGGFSTLTLSAKTGYRLLCLYVTVENDAADDLYTSRLLDTVLHYGADYTNKAQDSFFYLNARGMFAGGLKTVGPKSTVNGCLLFAVPDDIETSGERLAVAFHYGGTAYECELRESGTRVKVSGEAASF